jgi:glycine dehydrogenase subunit 1
MPYLPHTDQEIASMLEAVGARDMDALFDAIPESLRRPGLDLADPMTDMELERHMAGLAGSTSPENPLSFMGAGSYEHYVPAVVNHLASRSEFYTAYTPYQPEISQGTLQAIYEYQTLTARLLGMEAANASLYDGATALAEALLMAIRVTRRGRVAVSRAVHPLYRRVVETYFKPTEYELVELPLMGDGRTDLSLANDMDDIAAVAVGSPNFFGIIEDVSSMAEMAAGKKALSIVTFTEPLAYGVFKSPGAQGADVACGEGQSLGLPRSFGGPGLGMFATRMSLIRNVPGRLVGQTKDLDGKRGFVLTLATREQHIRREKAVSNICTNNSLCALSAAMYMASLGATGFRELAALNRDKTEHLKKGLMEKGCEIRFDGPTFNEFVVKFPGDGAAVYQRLLEKGIVPGLPLAPYYPDLDGCYLVCATETKTREDLDRFAEEVAS